MNKIFASLATLAAGTAAFATMTMSAPAASAHHYTYEDSIFIEVLDAGEISYLSTDGAITAGRGTCDFLAAGYDFFAAATIMSTVTGLDDYDSGYVVGAAMNAYCPEFL